MWSYTPLYNCLGWFWAVQGPGPSSLALRKFSSLDRLFARGASGNPTGSRAAIIGPGWRSSRKKRTLPTQTSHQTIQNILTPHVQPPLPSNCILPSICFPSQSHPPSLPFTPKAHPAHRFSAQLPSSRSFPALPHACRNFSLSIRLICRRNTAGKVFGNMSFYEPQGWQAPVRQASWEQPPPPSRSGQCGAPSTAVLGWMLTIAAGASSTSQREDGTAFAIQFEGSTVLPCTSEFTC